MTTADPNIHLALASGLSPVCGTCAKWHQGVERSLAKCTATESCGSPLVGDTFHEYDGPITNFLSLCFICGAPPTKAVVVGGHVRKIGVCTKHVEWVAALKPTVKPRLPLVPIAILGGQGETLVREPVEKKTLGALINKIAAEEAKTKD